MGVANSMSYESYPEQGSWLGERCEVVFNYDTSKVLYGVYVRDDKSSPVTIIKTDCGRYILTTECQHRPL